VTPEELARACAEVMWSRDRASQQLGMRLLEVGPGRARLSMTVRDDMVNGWDICHGGFIATLADSAFAFACNTFDRVTVASGFDVGFLEPGRLGDLLVATAVERARRRRTGVYDVTVRRGTEPDGPVLAEFRGRSHSTDRPILGSRPL
jgi:acyl-CoA thioesterase